MGQLDDTISILVISEYPVVRLGLSTYFHDKNTIASVWQVGSLSDATDLLKEQRIDVVIVDLGLLKPSGLSAIKGLLKQEPGIKIIVLSRSETEPFVTKCIENGALGFISLKIEPDEIMEAVHAVHRNEKYLSKSVAYQYAIANLNKNSNTLSSLTNREYQVFTLLAQGRSINEIAGDLFISSKTVHVYRANIMSKLQLDSAFELTLMAIKNGIISVDAID